MPSPKDIILQNGLDPHENSTYALAYKPELIDGQFEGKHILTVEQLTRKDLDTIFNAAFTIREKIINNDPSLSEVCRGLTMVSAFMEPSTRTDLSFQAAMGRLGGQVSSPGNGWEFSSFKKGERGTDTTSAIACYFHVIVHRHKEAGSTYRAAHHIDQLFARGDIDTKPVLISGGDGIGEHPTQALLDLFTIIREKGEVDGLTITLVGDLLNGRTVHSLAKLLVRYQAQNVTVNLVSPDILQMPPEIVARLMENNISVNQTPNIQEVIGQSDVIYWTRVQKERFSDSAEYEAIKNSFILTPELMSHCKPNAIIMHPLPRDTEMGTPTDHDVLDADPRTKWITEMQNGLYVRMALLAAVTGRLDRLYHN